MSDEIRPGIHESQKLGHGLRHPSRRNSNVIYDNFSVKWNGKKMSVQQWTVTCNLATGGKPKTQTVHGAVHKVIFKGMNNRLFNMLTIIPKSRFETRWTICNNGAGKIMSRTKREWGF